MRVPAAALLALVALGLSGCGPTDEEVGRAVLFTALIPHAFGTGLMVALFRLWRPLRSDASMDLKPTSIAFGVLLVAAVLSLFGVTEKGPDSPDASGLEGVLDLAWLALLVFGASYLSLWLIVWRIWLAKSPRTAFTWSFLPVLAILIWPCPIMALGVTEASEGWRSVLRVIGYLWMFPGYGGLVTCPVIIILLTEALIRGKRAAPPAGELRNGPASC